MFGASSELASVMEFAFYGTNGLVGRCPPGYGPLGLYYAGDVAYFRPNILLCTNALHVTSHVVTAAVFASSYTVSTKKRPPQ